MADDNKNYTLGRGRLYFAEFVPGTKTKKGGRRYLGNTTALTTTQTEDNLDHFDSDEGLKEKDDSVTISNSTGGSFTTDNISGPNMAMWFKGDEDAINVAPANNETMDFTAEEGAYYQLGVSEDYPMGVDNVTAVTFKKGGANVAIDGNFDIDLEQGTFQILPGAPGVTDGDVLTATFSSPGGTDTIIATNDKTLVGELYFESTNPKGPRTNALFSYAKLTPDGDFAWKGDDWQAMTFTIEALKKDRNTPRVILKRLPTAA